MRTTQSRRQFLHHAALGAGTLFLTGWQKRSRRRQRSANERLDLGIVGVAGFGQSLQESCLRENVKALCDVDTRFLDETSQRFPKAAVYTDFRRMLDREDLDGVLIATPDHTHAVISAYALQQGCDVFCSDPMTRTVSEARTLATLARRRGKITQLEGSLCSPDLEKRVIDSIRNGELGTISEIYAWTDRTHGEFPRRRPQEINPPYIDYDLWLGPTFPRPYRPEFLPSKWRHWWHFGGGTLGDIGSPYFSLAHRAVALGAPTRIEASGPALHLDNTPSWLQVRLTYAQKDPLPTIGFYWSHGPEAAQRPASLQSETDPEALVFVGNLGTLKITAGRVFLIPNGEQPIEWTVSQDAPSQPSRLCEWIECCRTRTPTTCPFEIAGSFTEAMLLGNVAYRTDRKLTWDSRKLVAPNLPDASEYIQHSYRPGWEIG